ncbi:SRPBCC family protein [Nocardia sp. NPDC050713]|uniref:SRPBCC family protein n=1 Tax=Nocardia sp. NPDC050713 TaxID=3154511 RepID=UPI00340AB7BD
MASCDVPLLGRISAGDGPTMGRRRQEGPSASMSPAFSLKESDDEFLAGARNRHVHVVDVPAPLSEVWAWLSADDALVSWSPLISGHRWTSPRPFGVGATRVVTLGHAVALTERFYRWDEQQRMSFSVESASIPGLRRFAEDLQLAATDSGTQLTWTFAVEGGRMLQPLLRAMDSVTKRITASIANGIVHRAGAPVGAGNE